MVDVVNAPWPSLRQDLTLHEGPLAASGTPTWTLHDASSHRFYRIGWLEFEILSRWGMADAAAIAKDINDKTPIRADVSRVEAVKEFVVGHELQQAPWPQDSTRFARITAQRRLQPLRWLLKHYLFLRIPLARPDRFLTKTLPYVAWLTGPGFLKVAAGLTLVALLLIWRQGALFRQSLAAMATFEGWLLVGLCLVLVKALHEFGHAYAAKARGCRVPAMGVAIMLLFPVLWTDLSEAWKLPRRRDRMAIDAAGLAVELTVAALASIAWSLLPPGILRTACYILATTTWIVTLTINISPFMRYDGYYLLMDFVDEPELQQRAFAMGRWLLRELLFNLGEKPPERLSPGRTLFFAAYAWATWTYRFFLFLGIALTVYHWFFKALGLFLMSLELIWFLLLPAVREFRRWWAFRSQVASRGNGRIFVLGGLIVLSLLFLPWRTSVTAPAFLQARQFALLFSAMPAQVKDVRVSNGQAVKAGELLIRLESPDVRDNLAVVTARRNALENKVTLGSLDPDFMADYHKNLEDFHAAMAEAEGLEARSRELVLTASLAGVVRDIPQWLRPGAWVEGREALGVVLGADGFKLEAFVPDDDVGRLAVGATGTFYPSGGVWSGMPVVVESVDKAAVRELPYEELASPSGGMVAAKRSPTGTFVPEQATYKVTCQGVAGKIAPLRMTMVGKVVLTGEASSLGSVLWRNTLGLLVRESGWN